MEICNSFELKYTCAPGGADVSIDWAFLEERARQYKATFSAYEVVGWYSTASGPAPRGGDTELHTLLAKLNESPVLMLLDPAVDPTKRSLPVKLYEGEMRVGGTGGEPTAALAEVSYSIQTVEAERIAVDQATKISPTGETAATQLTQHLDGMHRAVKMLHARVGALRQLLVRMDAGEIPMDHALARRVAALARRLPALDTAGFRTDFLKEYNDGMLAIYLATITRGVADTAELVDKLNLVSGDKAGPLSFTPAHVRAGHGGRFGGGM